MKRWMMLVGVVALLVGWRATAQDDGGGWRLHEVTAAEYLAAVPEILDTYASEIGEDYYLRAFYKTVALEIASRHSDLYIQHYDEIKQTYDAFNDFYSEGLDQVFWRNALVFSLINAETVNLDTQTELRFPNMEIDVTAIDFDSDGSNEWILDIDEENAYHSYAIAQRINNTYYPAQLPLPSIRLQYEFGDVPAGTLWSLTVDDLNADGKLEWVVVLDHVGEYADAGRLYILSWHDGRLIDIGEESLSFLQPSTEQLPIAWEFLNLDSDRALEIKQSKQVIDNWGCEWTESTVFKWNEAQFVKSNVEQEFPATPGCIRRQAEDAMWNNEWETAIGLYEKLPRTRELADTQIDQWIGFSTQGAYSSYTDIRLATAYLSDGRLAKGIEFLRELKRLPETKFRLTEYLDVLLEAYDDNPTAVGVCIEAYDYIMYKGYYFWEAANLEVGYTVDNQIYGQGMYIPGPASPISAACNAPALIAKIINGHSFTDVELPAEQLEKLGISTGYSFSYDFNHDGRSEWLVWPTIIQVSPIFFVSDRNVYHISRPSISGYPPDEYNQIATLELPNDTGTALINLDFARHYYQTHAGFGLGGGPGCPSFAERTPEIRLPDQSGKFSLWRFQDNELVFMFDAALCQLVELNEIVPLRGEPKILNVWIFDDYVGYIPVTFTWDDALENYVPPPDLPTPTPPAITQAYTPGIYELAITAQEAYTNGDYAQVLGNFTAAQAQDALIETPGSVQLSYLNALALEALNRPEEALATYVAIYEAASESAWGRLAGLHIERV